MSPQKEIKKSYEIFEEYFSRLKFQQLDVGITDKIRSNRIIFYILNKLLKQELRGIEIQKDVIKRRMDGITKCVFENYRFIHLYIRMQEQDLSK